MMYGMMMKQATMLAFVDTFRILGYLFLIMVPLTFLMKKTRPHKGPMIME